MTHPVTLVIIGYESERTRGGGLSPVVTHRRSVNKDCVLLTPLHHRANGSPTREELTPVATVAVLLDDHVWPVQLLCDSVSGTYYLDARDAFRGTTPEHCIFAGSPGPYDTDQLLRDAIFFGCAAHQALTHLEQRHGSLVVEAQDWEGASISLATNSYPVTLTMHNTYDSGAVSAGFLARFGIDHNECPGPSGSINPTVLQRALPRIRGPIRTVSSGFADDLTNDPLQTRVLADHLQAEFRRRGIIGIENGPFKEIADGLCDVLVPPNPRALRKWKLDRRATAILAANTPVDGAPVWGNQGALSPTLPWFFMAGRNDIRQKGFDIAADAALAFLNAGGKGQFIFCPLIAEENLNELRFLLNLAKEFPDRVVVFAGFCPNLAAFRQGADFGLMPSIYEPFGMANEYYLDGVPVVARATGGITQQVIPLRSASCYSTAVQQRTTNGKPTGILFREPDALGIDPKPWRLLNNAHSDYEAWHSSALHDSMVKELTLALRDAEQVISTPHLYADMTIAGVMHIEANFSWHKNKEAYKRQLLLDLQVA